MGNSAVSYPIAIGEKDAYFMLDKTYIPIKHIEKLKLNKTELSDLYSYYHNTALCKHAIKMIDVKNIVNRLW